MQENNIWALAQVLRLPGQHSREIRLWKEKWRITVTDRGLLQHASCVVHETRQDIPKAHSQYSVTPTSGASERFMGLRSMYINRRVDATKVARIMG